MIMEEEEEGRRKTSKESISNDIEDAIWKKIVVGGTKEKGRESTCLPEILVVFLHGVHGTVSDFARLVPALEKAAVETDKVSDDDDDDDRGGKGIFLLMPTCNQSSKRPQLIFSKTKEGIEACAERALRVVENTLKRPDASRLRKIVVLGHSFGGIYGRYLLKRLVDRNIVPETLEPLHYISVASPHLGIRRKNGVFFAAYRSLAPALAGTTATELLLQDDDEAMRKLSEGPFLRALGMFRRRTCYGNVFNDINVPLCTSTLRARNPYRQAKTKLPRGIVRESRVSTLEEDDPSKSLPFSKDPHGALIRSIRSNLIRLGWNRVDCSLWGPLGLAHVQIIGQQAGGEAVQKHIATVIINEAI